LRRSFEHVVDADLTALGERAQRLGGGETNKDSDCEELHFGRRGKPMAAGSLLNGCRFALRVTGANRIEI